MEFFSFLTVSCTCALVGEGVGEAGTRKCEGGPLLERGVASKEAAGRPLGDNGIC